MVSKGKRCGWGRCFPVDCTCAHSMFVHPARAPIQHGRPLFTETLKACCHVKIGCSGLITTSQPSCWRSNLVKILERCALSTRKSSVSEPVILISHRVCPCVCHSRPLCKRLLPVRPRSVRLLPRGTACSTHLPLYLVSTTLGLQ